jgi:hypothetical protein
MNIIARSTGGLIKYVNKYSEYEKAWKAYQSRELLFKVDHPATSVSLWIEMPFNDATSACSPLAHFLLSSLFFKLLHFA